MLYPDPDVLRANAQQLRREAFAAWACAAAIKWRALLSHRVRRSPPRRSHAPYPCQSSAPSHP